MSDAEVQSYSAGTMKKTDSQKVYHGRDPNHGSNFWTDGLICAFEYVGGHNRSAKSRSSSNTTERLQVNGQQHSKVYAPSDGLKEASSLRLDKNKLSDLSSVNVSRDGFFGASDDDKESQVRQAGQYGKHDGGHWVPIGWARISELVQTVQVDAVWSSHQFEFEDSEDDFTVADLAAPYWERPAGPIWWCHVSAGHPTVEAWLNNAPWLHPAVSLALRDESRLISDRMKHLFYEVLSIFNFGNCYS